MPFPVFPGYDLTVQWTSHFQNVKMFSEIRQHSLIFTLTAVHFFKLCNGFHKSSSYEWAAQGHNNPQVQVKTWKSSELEKWDFRLTPAIMWCLCTVGLMYECCATVSTSLRLHFDFPVINNALLCSVFHLFPVVTSALLNKLWITPVQPAAYLFYFPVKLFCCCCFSNATHVHTPIVCTNTQGLQFPDFTRGLSCKSGCLTQISYKSW